MSRKRKFGKAVTIPCIWLSAERSRVETRYNAVGSSLMRSPAFLKLKPAVRMLYLYCADQAGNAREFQMPASMLEQYGFNERTARRYFDILIEAGFLDLAQSGQNTRTPNDYRFSDRWRL